MLRLTKWLRELDTRVVLLFSAALVTISFGTASTVSYFTDQTVTTVQVSAGTIELGIGDENLKAHTLDLGAEWYPGASKIENVTLHNSGVFPMTYSAQSYQPTGGLLNRIDVTARIDGVVVFEGKMNEISIPERVLPIQSSEIIEFTMVWPWHDPLEEDDDNEFIEAYSDLEFIGADSSNTLLFTAN